MLGPLPPGLTARRTRALFASNLLGLPRATQIVDAACGQVAASKNWTTTRVAATTYFCALLRAASIEP